MGTLAVVAFYLIAQMVGAGVLIQALVGIDFSVSVLLTGAFMLCYVIFGGMIATTWVQIVKAVLLMIGIAVMSVFVLERVGFNPVELFDRAEEQGREHLLARPGVPVTSPLDTLSLGLALVLGTAGLPHILMRFFTVPNAKAARKSVVWAMFLIGVFYLLTTFIGFGARAILGPGGEEAAGKGGNLAAPTLAAELGGGEGTFGGDLFLALIAASPSRRSSPWSPAWCCRRRAPWRTTSGRTSSARARTPSTRRSIVARIAAASIGAIAIVIAIIGGEGLNVSFMVGLAFAVAASANFPALLMALIWPRFNTAGAVTGVLFGVISAIGLVIVSPGVGRAPTARARRSAGSREPGIISIPLGFIGCWLGTVLSSERGAEHSFHELYVRSETGLGAEKSSVHS